MSVEATATSRGAGRRHPTTDLSKILLFAKMRISWAFPAFLRRVATTQRDVRTGRPSSRKERP